MQATDATAKTDAALPATSGEGMQFFAAYGSKLPRMKGRRDWQEYLDYGVTNATNGRMRAQQIIIKGKTQGTGWHYHLCELQFFYVFGGHIELRLETGETVRLEAGDAAFIPGGFKHAETDISDDFNCLEISVPADLGTASCEKPEIWRNRPDA